MKGYYTYNTYNTYDTYHTYNTYYPQQKNRPTRERSNII